MNGLEAEQDYDVPVGHPEFPALEMEGIECPNPVAMFTVATWPPPMQTIWSNQHGFETFNDPYRISQSSISPSMEFGFAPSRDFECFPGPSEFGSTPFSPRSSSASTRSTNTSYHESDRASVPSGGTPSPSPPPLTAQSSSFIRPNRSETVLNASTVDWTLSNGRRDAPNRQLNCHWNCKPEPFGRPAELRRHHEEQHQCAHEDCATLRFRTPEDTKEHEKTHCKDGLGYQCGICMLNGVTSKPQKREAKFKDHLEKVHKIQRGSINLTEFQCSEPSCCPTKKYGGFIFDSQKSLETHQRNQHAKRNDTSVEARRPGESRMENTNGKRPLESPFPSNPKRIIPSAGENDILPVDSISETAQGTKAYLGISKLRMDAQLEPSNKSVLASGIEKHSGDSTPSDSSQPGLGGQSSDPVEKTFFISMMEIRALINLRAWKEFVAKLRSLDVCAVFNKQPTAIKLRCSSAENLKVGNTGLQQLIEDVRTTINRPQNEPTTPVKENASYHQQVSIYPQPEISALDKCEDAEVLALYNSHLLPEFPSIVQAARINGTYSVSLVRQEVNKCPSPIIRFRSAENQSKAARFLIRKRVEEICAQHARFVLPVQFSQGKLVHLANIFDSTVLDDPPNDCRFPHERRYHPLLCMGVSIGIRGCPHVSATSGGYVSADGMICMLTIDHWLSACPNRCRNSNEVLSPSISDAQDVLEQARRKLEELSLLSQQDAPDELVVDQDFGTHIFSEEIDREMKIYEQIRRESEKPESDYTFGRIQERCGMGQPRMRASVNPGSFNKCHRMDWSLIRITAQHRKGQNRHRYERNTSPSLEEVELEIMSPEGRGELCSTTVNVFGGETVHYVGTTSGFRLGSVNPAMVQYKDDNGNVSHEWSMVVPSCERLRARDFQGDSGAWIISENDELLGQLWGWDNGNLLFTPIVDIFADIAQKMDIRPDEVNLPQPSLPGQGLGLLSRICAAVVASAPENNTETDKKLNASSLLSPLSIAPKGRRSRGSSLYSVSSASDMTSLGSSPVMVSHSSVASMASIRSSLSVQSMLSADTNFSEESNSPDTPQSDGIEMRTLPKRRNDRRTENWVSILPNGESIDERLSGLHINTDPLDCTSV